MFDYISISFSFLADFNHTTSIDEVFFNFIVCLMDAKRHAWKSSQATKTNEKVHQLHLS